MRKIFLNGRFLTQSLTGVQRTAYELVMALDELIDSGAINPQENKFILIYSGIIKNHISLKHISLVKRGFLKGNLWEQLELPFYTAGNLLVSMCTISSLFKRRQLVMVHDASFLVNPQFFSSLFRMWYKLAIPFLGKMAKGIITVSNFSKAELVKHAGIKASKIKVIYNSAEHVLKYGEPGEDFKNKIAALKPYCLAVSSLSANKNFNGLHKAINSIDFKNYNMLIAGGIVSTLQTNVAAGKAINYLGYVSNDELKYLYANSSLFIFPSFYEGFGIPPLEAMIMGCPVLASHTSSLPEVLGNACAYCNPADPGDIALKISQLINDPNLMAELQKLGHLQAVKYSWKNSALQLFDIIKSN